MIECFDCRSYALPLPPFFSFGLHELAIMCPIQNHSAHGNMSHFSLKSISRIFVIRHSDTSKAQALAGMPPTYLHMYLVAACNTSKGINNPVNNPVASVANQ